MKTAHSQSAFSLVEITLALGIAAFTLISIFGLLPVGLNTSQGASEQTTASYVATGIASDLRVLQPGTTITGYGVNLANAKNTLYFDQGGDPVPLSSGSARYQATIDTNTAVIGRTATCGAITVSWPAKASLANAQGFVKIPFALDKN